MSKLKKNQRFLEYFCVAPPNRQLLSSKGNFFINANFCPPWNLIYCTIFSIFNLLCYGILTISYNSCHVRRIIIITIPRNKEQKVRSSQSIHIAALYFKAHIFPAKIWILKFESGHANATPTLHDSVAKYYSDNIYSLPKEKTLKNWCCTIT